MLAGRKQVARRSVQALALAVAGLTMIVAGSSCTSQAPSYEDCDAVYRHCRTVCDYFCDRYGCYPVCYDYCWSECYREPRPPEPAPLTPPDAGSVSPPAGPASGGTGILCAPCASNDECQAGALCIVRGGDAAASGFCGHACQSSSECPEAFACVTIGSSRQCVPTGDTCN